MTMLKCYQNEYREKDKLLRPKAFKFIATPKFGNLYSSTFMPGTHLGDKCDYND